jgi:uncharacterized protein involved in exopolysaccharide biosynthesis
MDRQDVRFYLSIFLRRLHYFAVPLVVVTLAGGIIALILPPRYLAVAKILVESPRILTDLARPSVPADAIQQVPVLEQQLTTRASLLGMAERFHIYPPDALPDDVVADMLGRTKIEPVDFDTLGRGSNAIAYAVSFEAVDPILAAEVANANATTIVEENARQRKARADETEAFLRLEEERLGAVLSQAQDAILGFKREHRDALPDSLEFRRMQLSTYQDRLRQLEREEASFQHRRSTIEQILATPMSGNAPVAGDQGLAELRRTLAEQESIFSNDSPNLRILRTRIADLEKRLSEAHASQTDMSQRTDISPELRVQFADIDGQLAFIAQEKEEIARALAELAKSIADTETNSTALSALQRSYEIAQAQYNEAVSKLAAASTGQRIETEAMGEKLTLIEPATPPTKPVWPKRRAIAGGSLAAGIGFGLGLVVLLEFWFPSIRRPADLASTFDGQPFATIPYISSDAEVFMRRLGIAVLVLVLLGSVPGVLLVREHVPDLIRTARTMISQGIGT